MLPGCKNCGPGYRSPLDAFKEGPQEKLLYTICIQPHPEVNNKPDYLAVIDVDAESPTFCQVINRLYGTSVKDEMHHFGWNSCSSCFGDPTKSRDTLIIPCLGSDRIYIVDVKDLRAPKIRKVIEPEEVQALGVSSLHTSHCSPTGDIMISSLGTPSGEPSGDFLLLDGEKWTLKGLWTRGEKAKFGYDFWYQPYWDIMVSSEWSAPKSFKKGFCLEECLNRGRSLNFYSWKDHKLLQTVDLGVDGITPLEVRFLHDPLQACGFVGCALNANIFRKEDNTWAAEKVISIPDKEVEGWVLPRMPGMVTDIVISLDDKYLYLSNWLHGDVRQYDISDPGKPVLAGQIFLGGSIVKHGPVKVITDTELKEQPPRRVIKGTTVYGSPQMLQLSLDGKRLYITTSLFSSWDKQIYPDLPKNGSVMMRVNVDIKKGGLTLDESFLIDFGKEPHGPVLAHETRYPGGDCTSDIWLAPK